MRFLLRLSFGLGRQPAPFATTMLTQMELSSHGLQIIRQAPVLGFLFQHDPSG